MRKAICAFLIGILLSAFGGVSPPDPYQLIDSNSGSPAYASTLTYRQTLGLTARSPVINTGIKNAVFLVAGQSLSANVTPTLYTPTNTASIDQLNLYDGQLYSIGGPLLGSTYNTSLVPPLGPGNIAARIADTLITNGKFNRVIIVPTSIGSTLASQWGDVGGIYANRLPVAMKRLAALGITPGMTGVTFFCLFDLGEQDLGNGTSQSAMTASLNSFISTLQATGFNGRIFIPLESGASQTSNAVRSAEAAVVNGTTVFSGGDFDSVTGRSDGVHWSDVGAAAVTTVFINATAASGAPF